MRSPSTKSLLHIVLAIVAIFVAASAAYVAVSYVTGPTNGLVAFGPLWRYAGTTTLTGEQAWQVCAALGIPCSSDPAWQASTYTKGYVTAYVVTSHLCYVPSGPASITNCATVAVVLIDSTAYCITAEVPRLQHCPAVIW